MKEPDVVRHSSHWEQAWKGRRAGYAEPQEQKFQQHCSAPLQCSVQGEASAQNSQEHICWYAVSTWGGRCVCFGCGFPCTWTMAKWLSAACHTIPAAAVWRKGIHKESTIFFNSLWSLKASVNEKNSHAWKDQSTKASVRHGTGKGKHYMLTYSQKTSASSKDLTHSWLKTSQCSPNQFLSFVNAMK